MIFRVYEVIGFLEGGVDTTARSSALSFTNTPFESPAHCSITPSHSIPFDLVPPTVYEVIGFLAGGVDPTA